MVRSVTAASRRRAVVAVARIVDFIVVCVRRAVLLAARPTPRLRERKYAGWALFLPSRSILNYSLPLTLSLNDNIVSS